MMLLVIAAACGIASAVGVGAFARWAERARLLDVPTARSSHQVPTPRGAGVVIVLVVTGAMAYAWSAGSFDPGWPAIGALFIAIVSGLDDLRSLPSSLRLTVHAVCATAALLGITGAAEVRWSGPILLLAIIGVVGLANAYNFMDGIDGIGGAQAVVTGITIAVAALNGGQPGLAIAGTAVAASTGGFLLHNWSPARVFMGDVGSVFLGFVFAVIAVDIATRSVPFAVAIVLSLWPFLFDTTFTLLRRAVRRENVLASHRSHLYQRLVIAGRSHAQVAAIYTLLGAAGGAAGLAWAFRAAGWQVLLAVPLMCVAMYTSVAWTEGTAAREGIRPGSDQGQTRVRPL